MHPVGTNGLNVNFSSQFKLWFSMDLNRIVGRFKWRTCAGPGRGKVKYILLKLDFFHD